jgi:enterochelin esterase-like enzyme
LGHLGLSRDTFTFTYLLKYPRNLVPVILPVHKTYEDGTECSETSSHKIQTPGNHPKEKIQHSQHGKSFKSRTTIPASSYNLTKAAKILDLMVVIYNAINLVSQ